MAGPSSVPKGMIFGLIVHDPRLSFPPKLDKSNPSPETSSFIQPSTQIAQVLPFWDPQAKLAIRQPRYRKSEIDARRSQLLIPGSRLPPTSDDNCIPILLSQRTLSPTQTNSAPEMSGWTLTIPAGWGMPFWQSLVFSETRVGGLRERSQQVFEAGAPRFPEDFPCTLAFDEYETRRADDDKSYFDRRPPAKRPNFDKLGVPDPFKSNFAGLVEQLAGSLVEKLAGSARDLTPWFVNTDVAEALALHLAGKPARKLARNPESLANILFHHYPRPTGGVFSILSALVRVTVVPCGRGAPEELGIIYKVDDQIWNSLREFVNDSHGGKEEDGGKTFEMDGAYAPIGRITTGSFSLRRGKGHAVGFVSLKEFLDMEQRDQRLGGDPSSKVLRRVCVARNRDSQIYRPVNLALMMS